MDKFANIRGAAAELSRTRRVNIYLSLFELFVALIIAVVFEAEISAWQQWGLAGAIFFPSILLICLIDHNIPQGAMYIWPKIWRIRDRQIWPPLE